MTGQLEGLRFTFTPNGKREFVSRDQVLNLIAIYCLELLLKNKYFHSRFIHKNCFRQFSSYFLFREIPNLNPTLGGEEGKAITTLHPPHIHPTSTLHRPYNDPHRPHIDPTSTLHLPHIDPTSTLHRPYIDPTSTPHRPQIDPISTTHRPHIKTIKMRRSRRRRRRRKNNRNVVAAVVVVVEGKQ